MAPRAGRHPATALLLHERIRALAAQAADAVRACEGLVQQAQPPAASAVDLNGTSVAAEVAGTSCAGREHGRRLRVDGGRVHDLEVRPRVHRVVVLMRWVAA